MNIFHVILFLSVFKNVCLESIWHSYHYDPIHQNREELVVTNITSDDGFKLDYVVSEWKSLCLEMKCVLVGLTEKSLVIVFLKPDEKKRSFAKESYTIDLEEKTSDFALFQFWNVKTQTSDVVAVVASKSELLWYRIEETNYSLFWSWPVTKNITHINIFQIDYDYHLLVINQYMSHITADLYQFTPDEPPNFWFRQKLQLADIAASSALVVSGPDYFLAIPQKSLNSLFIYKLKDNKFISYKNLTSRNVDEVVTFSIGQKSFLVFNSGIYSFTKTDLIKERVTGTHLDGMNYWLPITLSVYGDDVILIGQRVLVHEPHKSFVVEVITYDGHKFEEHEDIPCSYFGEEVLGLSCLPDEEAQKGIRGSASVYLDGVLGLVIPRKNRSSELFTIKTEIKKIQNPLKEQIEEFNRKKEQIGELLKIQESRHNEVIARESIDSFTVINKLDDIEQDVGNMKETVFNRSVEYDRVIFNSVVNIENGGVFDQVEAEKINGEFADALLRDVVLKNNVGEIKSPKSFTALEVKDLIAESVNDVDSKNLLFSNDDVEINGSLFVQEPLIVFQNLSSVTINGLVLEEEIVDLESPQDGLVFDNMEIYGEAFAEKVNDEYIPTSDNFNLENLFFPGNLHVINVNGENFEQLLRELCLKNIRNYIPDVIKIKGDVMVLNNAEISFLNGLKFPEEYVFLNNSFSHITGAKNFTTSLRTSKINCPTINDIPTSEIITLSTDQTILGTTTFKNLEITEGLNVSGQIIGEHASKFLPNPTLLEKNFVKSKVQFKNLQVDGAIIVTENFNGRNLEFQLSDIIYANEESSVIGGIKKFPQGFNVRKNLLISSNSINNISLDSIVTKNTEQILNLNKIEGAATFANVETQGLYDSVDVKQLDEELVKLYGEQYISSTLVFEEEVDVNRLEVVETITNLSTTLDAIKLGDIIDVDDITVEGNVYGEIDNFNLNDFVKKRMSFTKDQLIDTEFTIDSSFVRNMLPGKINGAYLNEFSEESWVEKLTNRFVNGHLKVSNFYAGKSVEIDRINNKTVMNLGGCFWNHDLKKHNLTILIFNDDVRFEDIKIDKLAGVDFERFMKNIIFKNETDVELAGFKTFLKGFEVKKLIETEKLNDVVLSNILTKYRPQEIAGPVTIAGDVFFQNVTVSETIASVPIKILTDFYECANDQFRIKGDVLFNRLAHIYDLQIRGSVDGKPVQELIDGMIYKDDDFKLSGLIIFENKVDLEKNIRVKGKINDVDLPAFVSDMVMITKDTDIQSVVRFRDEVTVEEEIILRKGLKTNDLNGVDVRSWVQDAIFVNRGNLQGTFLFENVTVVDSLRTGYINNINFDTLVPLRTQQDLPEMNFKEISLFNDVGVGKSTNFRNLPEEFDNSVLIDTNQDVNSDVEFIGNVFVEGDIKLSGLLNEIESGRVVTTNTEQDLSAVFNFKSKVSLENLTVDGLVNGIDIDKWSKESVRVSSLLPQNITDDWIAEDLIFEEDVSGNSLLNKIDFGVFSQEIEEKRNYKYQIEKGFIDDYTNICKDLTYMYDHLKTQIYKFDHFRHLQTLNFQFKIDHFHHYTYQNKLYLLINEKNNCESYLFVLESRFRYMKTIHFGQVAQTISVRFQDSMYLVVRNQPFYSTCKVQGTNLWQLNDDGFIHEASVEDQDLLQESLEAGTFYGLRGNVVTEFRVLPNLDDKIRKYRKWQVEGDNMAFVPRGLKTGLAVRTGKKLIKLYKDDPVADFDSETEEIIIGKWSENFSPYLPGRKGSDLVVMKVGIKSSKRNLLAVASHEETSVKGSLDFIKIYEDITTGRLFHKVPSYKPSSLVSFDFKNGETLLAFMEDENVLQVYEYKGIEGFKRKLSTKLEGTELFVIEQNNYKILGVVNQNKITFMEVVMLGNRIETDLDCSL